MRVYALRYEDTELEANVLRWFASVRQAKAEVRRLHREDGGFVLASASLTPHDIPTKLDGLLDWLNSNYTTDNG